MPESSPWWQRYRVVLGLVLAASGAVGLAWAVWPRDPWPIRAVIPYSTDNERLSWPGFSTDSRSFHVTRRSGVVEVYDVQTGQRREPQPNPALWSEVRSHDGRSLAGGAGNDPDNPEVVWLDAASGAVRGRLRVPTGRIWNLAFSPDDRSLRIIAENTKPMMMTVATWDLAAGTEPTWERMRPYAPGLQGLTPDGRSMVCVDSNAGKVWLDDELLNRLPSHRTILTTFPANQSGGITHQQLAFTPDGRTLVLVSRLGEATFWDLATGKVVRTLALVGPDEEFQGLDFTPDGRTLAVSRLSTAPPTPIEQVFQLIQQRLLGQSPPPPQTVALLDPITGQLRTQFRTTRLLSVAPDGRSAATFEADGTIALRTVPPEGGR